ncbi:24873_t:CDS:1, partial [Racocetra persica]
SDRYQQNTLIFISAPSKATELYVKSFVSQLLTEKEFGILTIKLTRKTANIVVINIE